MRHAKRILLAVLFWGLITIGPISVILEIRGKAQTELVSDLTQRLTQEGVPLKDVKILNQKPYEIEISLIRAKNKNEWSSEDLWWDRLTQREVELSYKKGFHLDGYTISILDPRGNLVDWSKKFLHPDDPSQKPYPFNISEPDNRIANKILLDQIDLYGFSLDSIEIETGIGSSRDVQLLKINLSAPDISAANESLTEFILSLEPTLNSINKQPGARIAVVWVKLLDNEGLLLLEYFWDLELHRATWHMAEGITGGWYSRPDVSEGEQIPVPSITVPPTSTVQSYPLPNEYKDSTPQPALPYP